MRIEWKIDKKRGNMRPELTYSVTLEEHEKNLAVPPLRIASTIPKPEDCWQEYCYPGQMERAATPAATAEWYDLETPAHRGGARHQSLRLPWRGDNDYPEVEASFITLREALEAEIARAYASSPMREERALHTSDAAKAAVAPAVLAERFLQLARKSAVQP